MKSSKKKNNNIFKLTLAFFLPVAFLVTVLFAVSVLVLQSTLDQVDYEILNFDNINELKQSEINQSLGLQTAPEPLSFRSASVEIADSDPSFIEAALEVFQADDNTTTFQEDDQNQDQSLENIPVTTSIYGETGEDILFDQESYQRGLQENLNLYLDKIEKDAYRNAVAMIFPVFGFLILLILILSYVAAKMVIRPIIKTAGKQKRFIADASHEIKTPLSLMKSEIEIFKKLHTKNEPSREDVDDLTSNLLEDIDRLTTLSEKLLHIARLDSKKELKVNERESCDTQDVFFVINDLVSGFSKKYPEKIISFRNEKFTSKIFANCENIKQIVEILIENACLHMVGGNKISIEAKKQKNFIKLKVMDNGKGIKPEDRAKVFDRFYRSENSTGVEGTGLGLSIAKELVEKDLGSIMLEEQEGSGTTFVIVYKLV